MSTGSLFRGLGSALGLSGGSATGMTNISPYANQTSGTTTTNQLLNQQNQYINPYANATTTSTTANIPSAWAQVATEPTVGISAHHEIIGRLIEMQKKYIERVEFENTKLKSENEELRKKLNHD